MTILGNDLDILNLIDFDTNINCVWVNSIGLPDCNNPAEWLFGWEPCKCKFAYLCTEHRDRQIRTLKSRFITGPAPTCKACQSPIDGTYFRPI